MARLHSSTKHSMDKVVRAMKAKKHIKAGKAANAKIAKALKLKE